MSKIHLASLRTRLSSWISKSGYTTHKSCSNENSKSVIVSEMSTAGKTFAVEKDSVHIQTDFNKKIQRSNSKYATNPIIEKRLVFLTVIIEEGWKTFPRKVGLKYFLVKVWSSCTLDKLNLESKYFSSKHIFQKSVLLIWLRNFSALGWRISASAVVRVGILGVIAEMASNFCNLNSQFQNWLVWYTLRKEELHHNR